MNEDTCKAFTSCLALHRGRFDRMDSDRRVAASIGDPPAANDDERVANKAPELQSKSIEWKHLYKTSTRL